MGHPTNGRVTQRFRWSIGYEHQADRERTAPLAGLSAYKDDTPGHGDEWVVGSRVRMEVNLKPSHPEPFKVGLHLLRRTTVS